MSDSDARSTTAAEPDSALLIAPTAHAASHGANRVFVLLAIAVVLLALAVKIWGLVALTFAATALVPVIFVLFIIISWPF